MSCATWERGRGQFGSKQPPGGGQLAMGHSGAAGHHPRGLCLGDAGFLMFRCRYWTKLHDLGHRSHCWVPNEPAELFELKNKFSLLLKKVMSVLVIYFVVFLGTKNNFFHLGICDNNMFTDTCLTGIYFKTSLG